MPSCSKFLPYVILQLYMYYVLIYFLVHFYDTNDILEGEIK